MEPLKAVSLMKMASELMLEAQKLLSIAQQESVTEDEVDQAYARAQAAIDAARND